ncbi:Gfo/Idh/MocA family protein [Jeotgalibacillus sp. R-1-5s-1]|uniref:Gfo/Idh/MocA family protein n=1 Tax=Jeotgalibacillus sp. R-1-5s-1 TaxID=2555897 RepID=UPI00106CCA73|nr:Gfo/Idh/MocA family oxidoreductase [Jeotgalibacillus sp. R-1-5s-1]TFE01293.1 Gfo/Idh/MocA family oxidoreductase [Jeotgalibacillus sp. R-1-5s-1]
MKTLSIGIIGLGAIGQRLIPAFIEHDHYEITAISDVNPELMNQTEKQHSLTAVKYADGLECIQHEGLDAIYIAVPPKWHAEYALAAAEKGLALLCEKPLANSIEEAEQMVAAVETYNVINAIHFPLHYSQEKALLAEKLKEIGEISRIELTMRFETWPRFWQQNEWINKREQGGFIREITPHFIQLTHELFGEINIESYTTDYPENNINSETSVIAFGTVDSNIPFLLNGHSGIGLKDNLTYRIYGTKGVLSLDQWAELKQATPEQPLTLIQRRAQSASESILDEFYQAVTTGDGKIVSFKEGLSVQRIFEQLL